MAPRTRILIVDDEAAIRFALSEYSGACGLVVDGAADLPSALSLLAGVSYGAVTTDLQLSGNDGCEGLQGIARASHCRPRPCIVLLSAFLSPLIEQGARAAGADAVLQKPLPLPVFKDLLNSLIGVKAAGPPGAMPPPLRADAPTNPPTGSLPPATWQ